MDICPHVCWSWSSREGKGASKGCALIIPLLKLHLHVRILLTPRESQATFECTSLTQLIGGPAAVFEWCKFTYGVPITESGVALAAHAVTLPSANERLWRHVCKVHVCTGIQSRPELHSTKPRALQLALTTVGSWERW